MKLSNSFHAEEFINHVNHPLSPFQQQLERWINADRWNEPRTASCHFSRSTKSYLSLFLTSKTCSDWWKVWQNHTNWSEEAFYKCFTLKLYEKLSGYIGLYERVCLCVYTCWQVYQCPVEPVSTSRPYLEEYQGRRCPGWSEPDQCSAQCEGYWDTQNKQDFITRAPSASWFIIFEQLPVDCVRWDTHYNHTGDNCSLLQFKQFESELVN